MRLFRPARFVSAPTLKPVCAAAILALSGAAHAGVVISQIYGANGNVFASDYVELFNNGTSAETITGWSIQYAGATTNGTFAQNGVTQLNGTLQPGQYFLVKLSTTTTGAALPTADATGSSNLSGSSGKVILANTTTGLTCNGSTAQPCNASQQAQIVDLLGYGSANFFEGTVAPAATTITALFRANGGCTDTNNNAADFAAGTPAPRNSSSPVNQCGGGSANQVIVPACPALSVLAGTGGSGSVTATDADSIVNGLVFTGTVPAGISLNTFTAATADGGTASGQVLVSAATVAGNYSLPLQWSNNEGQTASCTLSVTVTAPAALTPIYEIQGNGSTSPKLGQTVSTSGVVTKVNNNGFFLQDPVGDGNAATSDGILVFTSTAPTVVAGQAVTLTGTVAEFDVSLGTANAVAEAHPVTELTNISGLTVSSSGNVLTPTDITLPATEAELEALEGMLVKINTQLTASQNYFLGRYGQITLSSGGRLIKPTQVARPGTADALSLAASNAQRLIVLDDSSSAQNPLNTPYIGQDNTHRAGDTIDSLTGVIDYGLITASAAGLADYKVHPTEPVNFTRAHPRTSAPASVGGNVKVASFNVLNYFTTFKNGATASDQSGQGCSLGGAVSASNCRGADNIEEFLRQRTKVVKALAALNADVVGLMEIQNNGNTAAQNLVDALNAEVGAGTYATIGLPAAGTGTDAIRVAMIYKPGTVTLNGSALSDTAAINNRPTLAQTFSAANGEKFSVVVNHFKSKGCDGASGQDADQGDGQGCYNDTRQQQAARLLTFMQTVASNAGDNDVLVIGDLNAYGKEDPIHALTTGGLTNLSEAFNGAEDYSYVFDGEVGALDHALASASALPQVSGTVHWHINADEPSIIDYERDFKRPTAASGCYVSTQTSCSVDLYSATPFRSSDHDPVLIGLNLVKTINGTSRTESITGTAGDDRITGGAGADTITGGAGRDVFVYTSMRDALDMITDFSPATDKLDLSAIAAATRATYGANVDLIGGGFIRFVDTSAGVEIRVDADGSAGTAGARTLVRLQGVTAAMLSASRDLLL